MSANAAVSHYEILGVPEHADTQAIEAAYRAGLAKVKASLGGGTPLPAEFFDRLREAY
jgi:curved DNA-binding protein CbpA